MTRDNVPIPTQPSAPAPTQPPSGAAPDQPADPPPAARQPAIGADVPAAIVRGAAQGTAQGIARAAWTHLTEKVLADPPDWEWARTAWHFIKELWP
ncbi:hypothetical protein [Streptomyces sp. M54]|uniref:hypothetical protein n=1 Tax=Streptomyces sp. M54 TaxID=2759525 RepID=UPI001A90C7DC|nr:hypothetical protein [Streptomyces sp. M54]QSS95543.1 hypothetical protein H3V39_34425 [Streptomyces sp. M54]